LGAGQRPLAVRLDCVLRHGGALIVFPAGEVAHRRRRDGSYADSPWVSTVGRLVRSTSAQVLPVFIAGRNSRLFYTLGRIHGSLRTALLARELLKRRGLDVTVRLGPPVAADDIATAPDAAAVTSVIRAGVDRLRLPEAESAPLPNRSGPRQSHTIAAEIARLPADACLVDGGRFQVFCTQAEQIPSTLFEIGRLREVTFRAIGEGTGRTIDLDRFDHHYLHLFSWDRERRQVVGAYRLGQTDRIVETAGIAGLYTRTLFRYDTHLIGQLSPALELGRSFVRSEYQRNYNALLLLWKGIGQFVVRHPRYRVLFGLVSISSRYSDTSHRLLMAFLRQNYLDRALAELVEAVNPAVNNPLSPAPVATAATVDEVNRLIAHAESDGKGVPVLLRQYLKLNARLLGFNVDPDFGSALDALMMVDLTTVDRAILCRYLGRREAAQFLDRHRDGRSANAA
jgi:putative hemolysin